MTRFWMTVQVSREGWALSAGTHLGSRKVRSGLYLLSIALSWMLRAALTELLVSCVSGLWEFLEQIYPCCEQFFEQLTYALSLTPKPWDRDLL